MDRGAAMTRPPAILCLDRDPTDADARRLRTDARIVCVTGEATGIPGTMMGVVGSAEAPAVIDAARRGWDLVIRLDLHGEHRRLVLEDLCRLGEMIDEAGLDRGPLLESIDDDLLQHLAAGATVRMAAQAVGLSDRTAARRLARLREVLGVATTAGLVARWRGIH
jgi:hypothetical protein